MNRRTRRRGGLLIAVAELERGAHLRWRERLEQQLDDARRVRLNDRLALGLKVVAALLRLREQQAALIERVHELALREHECQNSKPS